MATTTNDKMTGQLFENMVFRMRPCSAKARIKKHILENGGTFAKAGEKVENLITLTDDRSEKHGIHMDFILDSINRKKLQPIHLYDLLKPKNASSIMGVDCSTFGKTRQAYQPEEDDAILNYVALHQAEHGMDGSTGGNLLWRKMEEQVVTTHTWQSMKSRYHSHLEHIAPSFPYRPIVTRCTGNTTVQYAVNRESPLTLEDPTQPPPKKHRDKMKLKGSQSTRKLYTTENNPLFSQTPPNKANNSQHISDSSFSDGDKNDDVDMVVTEKQQPSSAVSSEVEKFFRTVDSIVDVSCDGIVREGATPNYQHDNHNDNDGDETQSLSECDPSPIKSNDETVMVNNNNAQRDKNVVLFTDGENNIGDDGDDEFDCQLIAQAMKSKQDSNEGSSVVKTKVETKKKKTKNTKRKASQKNTDPCTCDKTDFKSAYEFMAYIDNLPDDFDWQSICDEIDF